MTATSSGNQRYSIGEPLSRFIPAAPAGGCMLGEASETAKVTSGASQSQPNAPAASITTGMPEDVEQLLRERRYDRALERLLDDYQHKVYRMVLGMLRDTGRAEDVTQDVFVKLWRALPLYDGRAALGTWLYAIA